LSTTTGSYTSHSFRRGFSSAFSNTDLPEHQLQLAGRWTSSCYRDHYIDISERTLKGLAQAVYAANT
jgi:hypothetical protein